MSAEVSCSAGLDIERLSAATHILDVRVNELEPLVEDIGGNEINRHAIEQWKRCLVSHNANAVTFKDMILFGDVVGNLKAMKEEEVKNIASYYRNGVHMATPVFDGAKEDELKNLGLISLHCANNH